VGPRGSAREGFGHTQRTAFDTYGTVRSTPHVSWARSESTGMYADTRRTSVSRRADVQEFTQTGMANLQDSSEQTEFLEERFVNCNLVTVMTF
jgi:hypothetical protein